MASLQGLQKADNVLGIRRENKSADSECELSVPVLTRRH
jgi:hypothetical protein